MQDAPPVSTYETIVAFMRAINARDVGAIMSLCAEDHRFVDAHGGVTPAERLQSAWTGYFEVMPHYGVEAEEIVCDGGRAIVFGSAWGSLDPVDPARRAWRRPCAWRALVRDGRIALWQVYVDTKPVFDLMKDAR
jgi:ketosteroid isomerase-like protein